MCDGLRANHLLNTCTNLIATAFIERGDRPGRLRRADNNLTHAASQSFSELARSGSVRVCPDLPGSGVAWPNFATANRSSVPASPMLRGPVTRRAAVAPRIATGTVVDGKIVPGRSSRRGARARGRARWRGRAHDRLCAGFGPRRQGISLDQFRAILQRRGHPLPPGTVRCFDRDGAWSWSCGGIPVIAHLSTVPCPGSTS